MSSLGSAVTNGRPGVNQTTPRVSRHWIAWIEGVVPADLQLWIRPSGSAAAVSTRVSLAGVSRPHHPAIGEFSSGAQLFFLANDGGDEEVFVATAGESGSSRLTNNALEDADLCVGSGYAVWVERSVTTDVVIVYGPLGSVAPQTKRIATGQIGRVSTDGSLVAWIDESASGATVRAYDMNAGRLLALGFAAKSGSAPSVSQNAIAWQDPASGAIRVWSPSIGTPDGTRLGAETGGFSLTGYGGLFAWVGRSAAATRGVVADSWSSSSASVNWSAPVAEMALGSGFGAFTVVGSSGESVQAKEFVWDRRIAGTDRYSTAVAISRAGFAAADNVVLATGENFPDALAGAPLAKALNAPILLTRKAALPATVLEEIRRLRPTTIWILGGESAVGRAVASALAGYKVVRIAGSDRYSTSASIAQALAEQSGRTVIGRAFVATGDNYPDALSAAGVAARCGEPILLVRKSSIPAATMGVIASLGVNKTVVLGGTSVVDAATMAKLPSPVRLNGADRYGTSARIAAWSLDQGLEPYGLVVATGANFPDALAAGVLSATRLYPTVLTKPTITPDVIGQFIVDASHERFDGVVFIGGDSAVSPSVASSIKGRLHQ